MLAVTVLKLFHTFMFVQRSLHQHSVCSYFCHSLSILLDGDVTDVPSALLMKHMADNLSMTVLKHGV